MINRTWTYIRPVLVSFKRVLFFERPWGLFNLGEKSSIKRPRTLKASRYISIGSDTHILSHSFIMPVVKYAGKDYHPSIFIGNHVYIGRFVYLTAMQRITISDGCVLSEHVYITDLSHGYDPLAGKIMSQKLDSKGPVMIGPNCFLGYRSIIMPGVTLGEWCIVGANSVVTSSFPAFSMIAGSPAKIIKIYSHKLHKWIAINEAD